MNRTIIRQMVFKRRSIIKTSDNITAALIFILLFTLSILNIPCSYAQSTLSRIDILKNKEIPWHISADVWNFDEKDSLYILKGNVILKKENQTLSANEAIYHRDTGVVEVSGNVKLESGEDILSGEKGTFNLEDQTGKINEGRIFLSKNHYYVSGDVMEKVGKDTYMIRNCRLTTCDGENPAWSITGSEVQLTIDGSGHIKNASLRVLELPIIYVPYLLFPVKTDRQTGLLPPMFGYSNRNGSEIEIPFFWAISEQTDATFYERYMSDRGLLQGLEFRYASDKDSTGKFLFDILSDRTETKNMTNPDQLEISLYDRTNTTRYWLRSRTDHQLPSGFQARLDTDYVSDQDYLSEFRGGLYGYEARPDLEGESGRPLEETQSPTRRSALRLSKENQDFSLQASSSYHQRPESPENDTTPQPLAGLDFALLPLPIKELPVNFSLDTDYDYVWRDFGQKGHSLFFNPKIFYPLFPNRYTKFQTYAGFTEDIQWLDNEINTIEKQSRYAYELGGNLSTDIERTFDFTWRDVTKLKHTISPSLSYEYRSHNDENTYQPWFEAIDDQGSHNLLTLSIENLLNVRKEGKEGVISYMQWGTFNISQGIDVSEKRRDDDPLTEKTSLEPMTGNLSLMLLPELNMDTEVRWDHYDDDFSYADFSLQYEAKRAGGKTDNYGIDYEYNKFGDRSLNYNLNINLVHGFSAGTSIKKDIGQDEDIDKTHWLEYLSQCWGLRLTAENQDVESRYMLTFRLLGLGDLDIK